MKKGFILSIIATALFAANIQAAEKIVSTAGYASEIIAILGKADNLVGVDTTSQRPVALMENKTKIGYRRQLSAEGILSLQPDLVILAQDAGPQAVVDQLKASKVKLLNLQDKQDLDGIRETISVIAKAINAEPQAKTLIEEISETEKKLTALRTQHSPEQQTLVLIDTGAQGVFALGKKTAGESLLKLLQLNNGFSEEGNKPFSTEALAGNQSKVILLASRNEAKSAVTITKLADNHPLQSQLAHTSAGKNGCVFAVNILDALGFGPYTAKYATEILSHIQPCLKTK